jgi:hypothetical protein
MPMLGEGEVAGFALDEGYGGERGGAFERVGAVRAEGPRYG